jgi:hypothetical protein
MVLLAAVALLASACGDSTGALGQMGRVEYSLYTTYLVQQPLLTEVGILTGHPQHIATHLTDAGEDRAGSRAGDIEHRVTPDDGVTIEQDDGEDDDIRDFHVTVAEPGTYTFEAVLDGDVFDRIELRFESPDELDLITRVRARNSEEWETLDPGIGTVEEGAQAAFLPIPIAADGSRIAGDFDVALEADPEWAITPAYNLLGVYEQEIVGSASPVSIYFIEPGGVTVSLTDEVNGVGASWDFAVLPVDQG